MTTAEEVIERIEAAGGVLTLHGERIHCRLPENAIHLVEELRVRRDEAIAVLRQRATVPKMPPGVRLLRWEPKEPPVMLERWAVVTDVIGFVRSTLRQLEHALSGRWWLAGHRSPNELRDYLEQCGCVVSIEEQLGPLGGEQTTGLQLVARSKPDSLMR